MHQNILILLLLLFSGLISCGSKEEKFFMRHMSSNLSELEKGIIRKQSEVRQSTSEYDAFYITIELAEDLTIAGREIEAIHILKPYIETPPTNATSEDMFWLNLNFATANQYSRQNDVAENYFKKAIHIGDNYNLDSIKHYAFHHYGRFLVERNDYELAKEYFTKALVIRRELKDKRITNTQKAIDTLELLIKKR